MFCNSTLCLAQDSLKSHSLFQVKYLFVKFQVLFQSHVNLTLYILNKVNLKGFKIQSNLCKTLEETFDSK